VGRRDHHRLDARIAEIEESRAQIEQQLALATELAGQVRVLLERTIVQLPELEPA